MEGGDLETRYRPARGGDLKTSPRQHGGIFGLIGKLFGLGPGELQKQMSKTSAEQMLMQRGGFPWALAGLSLLPTLLGKGKEDTIQKQMKTTRDTMMQRGGLTVPPALLAKGLPLLKHIGIPLAVGALSSVGDKVVDKVFGEGKVSGVRRRPRHVKGRRRKPGRPRTHGHKRSPKKKMAKQRTSRMPSHPSSNMKQKRRTKRMPRHVSKSSGKALVRRVLTPKLKRAGLDIGRKIGRRLVQKSVTPRSVGKAENPIAAQIRRNMAHSQLSTTPTSAHIGQSFNA